MGLVGKHHALVAYTLGNKLVPVVQSLGGPQDQCGWMWKGCLTPPTLGFGPWTVQPIASCSTD